MLKDYPQFMWKMSILSSFVLELGLDLVLPVSLARKLLASNVVHYVVVMQQELYSGLALHNMAVFECCLNMTTRSLSDFKTGIGAGAAYTTLGVKLRMSHMRSVNIDTINF